MDRVAERVVAEDAVKDAGGAKVGEVWWSLGDEQTDTSCTIVLIVDVGVSGHVTLLLRASDVFAAVFEPARRTRGPSRRATDGASWHEGASPPGRQRLGVPPRLGVPSRTCARDRGRRDLHGDRQSSAGSARPRADR